MSRWAVLMPKDYYQYSEVVYAGDDELEANKMAGREYSRRGAAGPSYECVACPDYVDQGWYFAMGVFCTPEEISYWSQNLQPDNLPPRTYEQLQELRRIDIAQRENVAIACVHNMNNWSALKIFINTQAHSVGDLKGAIESRLHIPRSAMNVIGCTNFWSPEEVMARHGNTSTSLRYDMINRLNSVLDGVPKGRPPVGVPLDRRQLLSDDVMLHEMPGRVVVLHHNSAPSTPWSPDLLEVFFHSLFYKS